MILVVKCPVALRWAIIGKGIAGFFGFVLFIYFFLDVTGAVVTHVPVLLLIE